MNSIDAIEQSTRIQGSVPLYKVVFPGHNIKPCFFVSKCMTETHTSRLGAVPVVDNG
jgi:hypothetical protein